MKEQILVLLQKKINNVRLTDEEQLELDSWIAASPRNKEVYDDIMNQEDLQYEIKQMLNIDSKSVWNKVTAQMPRKNKLVQFFRHHPLRYAAAIALLMMLSFGAYMVFSKSEPAKELNNSNVVATVQHDIAPPTDKAVLTTSDGKKYVVDDLNAEVLSKEAGFEITKTADGKLVYKDLGNNSDAVKYNTLFVPRGGKPFKLVLIDGSMVTVNAASSVTYPLSIRGNERKLSLTGEAFFDVEKVYLADGKTRMPFVVDLISEAGTSKGQIEVLGTHFNVNSYDDEVKTKVTLVEGSVAVRSSLSAQPKLLKPNQQAVLQNNKIVVEQVTDMEKILAWKNNKFIFRKEEDIQSVMREVSRWYDANIEFKDNITEHYVATGISRDVPVTKLLEIFETMGGIKFEINDKTILIRKR